MIKGSKFQDVRCVFIPFNFKRKECNGVKSEN